MTVKQKRTRLLDDRGTPRRLVFWTFKAPNGLPIRLQILIGLSAGIVQARLNCAGTFVWLVLSMFLYSFVFDGDPVKLEALATILGVGVTFALLVHLITIAFFVPVHRNAAKLLEFGFCPSCAYTIEGLQADRDDGCVVCPECSSAWRMPESSGSASRRDAQHPPVS